MGGNLTASEETFVLGTPALRLEFALYDFAIGRLKAQAAACQVAITPPARDRGASHRRR
jgi:hypothetical protein